MMISRYQLSLLGLALLSIFSLTGFGCRATPTAGEKNAQSIVVWGLWQDSDMMDPVVQAFEKQYGVKVEYKKIASVATYEKTLLEALAQGRGPDVFVIHHSWVEGKRGIMNPAPSDIVDEKAVREEFVDVVGKDLVRDGFVYALPTSVDTLALFSNQDLLAAAGIAKSPANWDELQADVQKLTKVNRLGVIEQSGIALGTAANVNRASDILQTLMLQSGLNIMNTQTNQSDMGGDIGNKALTFYTDFANKSKKVFTWDLQQDYSLDAFASGKTAMMVSYAYNLPTIQAKNPRLNIGISTIPQISSTSQPLTLASYWPFAVSHTSRFPLTSWQFVRFLTSSEVATQVNTAQKVPPARRDGVSAQQRDVLMGVFAQQALIATTWPRVDIDASDGIFNKMIDDVVTGGAGVSDALRRGQDQLQTLKQNDATQ